MADFEKLGLFYLGRRRETASGPTLNEPVLYDSRDLVTHAVCVGMTGSGKTGLCVGLIEEAALDGIPVLAIDPKGDLGNLLLTFPHLSAEEFRPWVDEDDARRAGVSADDYASQQAQLWVRGLSAWGQDRARIARLRDAATFRIFTPGSRAGWPVSVLSSFAAPPPADREDLEGLHERAAGTATSALVLAGVDAPPRSREHTLVAMVLAEAWQRGQDLDLATLIRAVQDPPFQKVGVVDLESFYPARDRFELAMQLNGALATPAFDVWTKGTPLDPQALLYTADSRPCVSILSIAHLGEAERMFFVSLLLNQMVAWMRRQTGTTSLRAILYMDEIAGYFPPVANPPSKPPLLTLLKQARAYGVGVVLATQNPVDLDYKGLSNTGTWFLGRLQTERDKARVLEGLDAVAGGLDRAELDRTLSALDKRVFLMHNVHDAAPTLFETRWTMSYLRGPLSREQVRLLKEGSADPSPARPQAAAAAGAPAPDWIASARAETEASAPPAAGRPIVPPGIDEFFLPLAAETGPAGVTYRPAILGAAHVSFSDRGLKVDSAREVVYLAPVTSGAVPVDWAEAARIDIAPQALQREPASADATFRDLPPDAAQPSKYAAWQKSFARWLAQHETLEVLRHRASGITSLPGESERDFRIRLLVEHRAVRDAAVDAVRRKYAARQAALAERLRRAEAAVEREQQQASDQKVQTAVSMGAALLGALLGRKAASVGTLGRATTAARGVGRSMKEASDVKRAAESVASVREAAEALGRRVEADAAAVAARFEDQGTLERIVLRPKRGQVQVQLVALAWVPSPAARR